MSALRELGYRRNYVIWRMSEWEYKQLQHVALWNSGANVTLKLEVDIRDNAWHKSVANA